MRTPGKEFLFGTDTMGRDIFSMIWYGGRISLLIGAASALISTAVAIVYGAASGCAPAWLDALMMRLVEILLSVPGLLSVVLNIVAEFGANILTIHQSIPINGVASLTLSIEVLPTTGDVSFMIQKIEEQKGVHYLKILGRE